MPSIDYILVKKVQSGDRGASLELYKKYARLIKKRSMITHDQADFQQSAFEVMITTVSKVDFDRIPDPETWGFYFMFSMDLLKKALKQNKEDYMFCVDRATYPSEAYLGDMVLETDSSRQNSVNSSLLSQTPVSIFNQYSLDKEDVRLKSYSMYKKFIATCSIQERKMLYLKNKQVPLVKCAQKLNISYVAAREMVASLKLRAERLIENNVNVNPIDRDRFRKTHGYHVVPSDKEIIRCNLLS
jgi:hypothetical protein